MMGYQKLQDLLVSDAFSFVSKWPAISPILVKYNISLLDLLKIMPCAASARIVHDYQKDYFKMVKIFQKLMLDKHNTFKTNFGFTEGDHSLPYKRITDLDDSGALVIHCFIMNEILPRGLYYLVKNGLTDLKNVFTVALNIDEFLLQNLRHKKNIEKGPNEIQNTSDEYWIRNTIALIKTLETFLRKAYKNERQIFEQTKVFLIDYKMKVEEEAIPCLKFYPMLKTELILALESSLKIIDDISIQNLLGFNKILLSRLKLRTYAFMDLSTSLGEVYRDFEADYSNKNIAIHFLRYHLNDLDSLSEIIESIGKKLDLIFLPNRADNLGLLHDIVSLIRFNDLLMFEVSEFSEKYALFSRIILWRLFSFCLYSNYAAVILGYIVRKFKVLIDKIEPHQYDYIYSLFCYLYVMDNRKCPELDPRTRETKSMVVGLLEMFLSNLDMKAFGRCNFFLRLDYDNENLRKNLAHIIKANNDLNAVFENIAAEVIMARKFIDKSVLLIAFAKKILLNLYINPQDESLYKEGKLKLFATLMLLFDVQELQQIDKKTKAYNYVLIETKLKLIIDCFGLIGTYPRSYNQKINDIHKSYEETIIKPFEAQCSPRDLIKFLQEYVNQNMFYKPINLCAIFKTLQRAEKATQDIQHSQIFFEKVDLETPSDSVNIIKWVFNLAKSTPLEFYTVFDMYIEILVGDHDLSFILIPFILYIYLQNCNDDDVNGVITYINLILRKGHSMHKMLLISAIKQLERWYFEGNQQIQSVAETSQKKTNARGKDKTNRYDEAISKMENFCNRFSQIKKLIDMEKLIAAQANFGDYKSAALNLEKLLEHLNTSNSQIYDGDCVEKLGLLYSLYSEINEDCKDISFEKILQRLKVPYDPTKIKAYTSQLNLKSARLDVPKEDPIYNDDKNALLADTEIELWHYILSSKKTRFNDDSVFFGFLVSMSSLCCHIMNTSHEYKTMLNQYKAQIDGILQNAKISLILSLLMIRNNYHSLYPFFLKAQIITDFEILFKIFIYTFTNAPKINKHLIQSMPIESQVLEISLDEMNEKFFMNSLPNGEMPYEIISFIVSCLRRMDNRIHNMEASYKMKLDWINTAKFMISLMRDNVKYYFDKTYFELQYKLLKLTYQNKDYQRAEIYYKKLMNNNNSDNLKKPIKCQFLLAKLTKKLKGKKDAMKILNEIKVTDDTDKIFEIKAKLKIAKYMMSFYAENDVEEKYRTILQQYKHFKNELMYFQHAKFLEENNPNPDFEKAAEIVQYYLESIKYGHEFIFQSLPRALRIWLDCCTGTAVPKSQKRPSPFQKCNDNIVCTRGNKLLGNNLVFQVLSNLEVYKLAHIIQVLVSRLDHQEEDIIEILCHCLGRIAAEYPLQVTIGTFSVWWLLPLKYFNYKDQKTEYGKSSKVERAVRILNFVKKHNQDSFNIINNAEPFYKGLLEFAAGKDNVPEVLLKENKAQIILPLRKYIDPILPKKNTRPGPNYYPYDPAPAYIICMDHRFVVMPSKERPKKITFICTGGKKVNFLVKYEQKGDVRKESRTIDYVNFVNLYLESSSMARDKRLKMRSFSIIPLCSRLNLSEWVNNTGTLKSLIEKEWKDQGIKNSLRFKGDRDLYERFKLNDSRIPQRIWDEVSKSKPVFQYFFWNSFGDANEWHDATLNYIKTTALWSAFGYLIGLGDRHCDNILLDKVSGEAVHIDFDCIFHKGKSLPVPEIVEFRLTKNIESPMGAFKSYALFEYYFKIACRVFQKNIDDLLGALDSFVNDPLIESQPHFKPLKTLEKVKKRVLFSYSKSLEEGVVQLIEDSKNEECLKEMFSGWMPHM